MRLSLHFLLLWCIWHYWEWLFFREIYSRTAWTISAFKERSSCSKNVRNLAINAAGKRTVMRIYSFFMVTLHHIKYHHVKHLWRLLCIELTGNAVHKTSDLYARTMQSLCSKLAESPRKYCIRWKFPLITQAYRWRNAIYAVASWRNYSNNDLREHWTVCLSLCNLYKYCTVFSYLMPNFAVFSLVQSIYNIYLRYFMQQCRINPSS